MGKTQQVPFTQQQKSSEQFHWRRRPPCYILLLLSAFVYGCIILMNHAPFSDIWYYHDIPLAIKPPRYICASPVSSVVTNYWSRHPFASTWQKTNSSISSVDIVFAVVSECGNRKLRNTIRETWGRRAVSLHLEVTFFVGIRDDCSEAVEDENNIYGDVVVLNVPESYDNLSSKVRSMFAYLNARGLLDKKATTVAAATITMAMSSKTLIAKVDDDVYVDVEALVGRLALLADSPYVYFGYQHKSTCVIRKPTCKWYDSPYPSAADSSIFGFRTEHNDNIAQECVEAYPSYAGGMFYVLSQSILTLLASYNSETGMFLPQSKHTNKDSDKHTINNSIRGVEHLPIWANEDSTVGTWIHAAMRFSPEAYAAALFHEPAIFPSRMVGNNKVLPIVVHLEWATGQHVLRRNRGREKEIAKAMLMHAASANLQWEGIAMGRCKFSHRPSAFGSPTKSLTDSIIKQKGSRTRSFSESNHFRGTVTSSNDADVFNRHLLYERPQDMYQTQSADYLEKFCAGKKTHM